MKVIRTYKKDQEISYQFSTGGEKTVQLADNIVQISIAGGGSNGIKSQLTNIDLINANISCLASNCFTGCNLLKDIYLSPQLKKIGTECFSSCERLSVVSFRAYEMDSKADELKNFELSYIGPYAFRNCPNLVAITLPESIDDFSKISPHAFEGSSITSITMLGISSEYLTGG